MAGAIAFVWDNFGPMHVDRVDAVARHFLGSRTVVGIEIFGKSEDYDWIPETGSSFQKLTLFPNSGQRHIGALVRAWKIVAACLEAKASDIFLCHYEHSATLFAALCLRALGRRVYAMGCSKFDDYKRTLWREVGKSFFYLPYCGGISSGKRARDYMRFLGIPEGKIQTEYNTVSIERICKLAGVDPAPGGPAFEERHFTIIARFIPKKNIAMALEAFELYRRDTPRCHSLHICGSGPLEADLKHRAAELGILQDIVFHGFVQTEDIARVLGSTLALLLPSVEEQFGNVVIEAQALGIPVILSDNCGARDVLVRSGVNGFVIEPDNPQGLAYFMNTVSTDRRVWESLALSARRSGTFGDVKQFALATQMLVGSAAKLIPSLGSQGGD